MTDSLNIATCPTSKGYLIHSFCSSPTSMPEILIGPKGEKNLASVELIVDDKNRAIPRLQRLLEIPYSDCLTPALLRLHPQWDPLRGDPRFQKLCEEKKP